MLMSVDVCKYNTLPTVLYLLLFVCLYPCSFTLYRAISALTIPYLNPLYTACFYFPFLLPFCTLAFSFKSFLLILYRPYCSLYLVIYLVQFIEILVGSFNHYNICSFPTLLLAIYTRYFTFLYVHRLITIILSMRYLNMPFVYLGNKTFYISYV